MLQRTFTRFFLWGQAKYIQQHFIPFSSSSSSPCPSAWLDGALRRRYAALYNTTTAEDINVDSPSLSEKVDQWSRRQFASSPSSSASLLPSFIFPPSEAVTVRGVPRPPVLRSPLVVVDRNEGTPLLSVLPWSPDELELWWRKEDLARGEKKKFLSSSSSGEDKNKKDYHTVLLEYVEDWERALSALKRILFSPSDSFLEEEEERGVEKKNTDKGPRGSHQNNNNNLNNKEEVENTRQNTNAAVMCAAESLQSGVPFSFLYHQKLIHETVHLSLDASIALLQQMKREVLHSASHKEAPPQQPLIAMLETSRWGGEIQRVLVQRRKVAASLDTRREGTGTVTTFLVCPGPCYGLSDGLQDVILAVLTGLWVLLSSPSSSTIRIVWRPHEKNCLGVIKLMEGLDRYSRKPENKPQHPRHGEEEARRTVLFPFHILLTANLTDQLIGPLFYFGHVGPPPTIPTTTAHRPCHVVHLLTSRLSSAETDAIEQYGEKTIKAFHSSSSSPIHKPLSEGGNVFFFYIFITALKAYRPQMVSLHLTSTPPPVEMRCSGSDTHLTKKDFPPPLASAATASAVLETVLEDIFEHAFFPYGTSSASLLKAHRETGVVTPVMEDDNGASPSLTIASATTKSSDPLQTSSPVCFRIDRYFEEGESAVVALRMVVPHHRNPLEEKSSITAPPDKKAFEMSVLRYLKQYLQTRYIPFLQHSLSTTTVTTSSKRTLSTAVLPDEWERIETQIKTITNPPQRENKTTTSAEESSVPSGAVLSFQHLLGGFLLPSKRGLYPLPCVCCAVDRKKKKKKKEAAATAMACGADGKGITVTSAIGRKDWEEVGRELESTLPIIRGRLLLIAFDDCVVDEEEENNNNRIKIGKRNSKKKVVAPLMSKDALQGSEKEVNQQQFLDYNVLATDTRK